MPVSRRLVIPVIVLLLVAVVLAIIMTRQRDTPHRPDRVAATRTIDLPAILDKELPIRVLVSYNRTNFFLDGGTMRGMEHDYMQAYRNYLLKHTKAKPVRLVFITVPFNQLLPSLRQGRGDIAAAGLTVTKKRSRRVAFSFPYRTGVSEIVVGSPSAPPIKTLDDLSGKQVHVLAGSSYEDHLRELNRSLAGKGLPPVEISVADIHLVTEDLLEMTERDIIEYTVADSHLVDIWQKVLPDLKPYRDVPLRTGGSLAWAVRQGDTALLKSLDEFARTVKEGSYLGNMVFKRYFENAAWVKNRSGRKARKRMDALASLFRKYGKKYDIDWLKLGALAYQESKLNMNARSHRGAVGIMQIRPATALSKAVGIKDYATLEGNIHAGTKYLRYLMDNYFQDVAPEARLNFALAAYNAGPNRIRRLRKKAKTMGLDPDRWFGNVEYAAYQDIGSETPVYVANVRMYYAAYKAIYSVLTERKKI